MLFPAALGLQPHGGLAWSAWDAPALFQTQLPVRLIFLPFFNPGIVFQEIVALLGRWQAALSQLCWWPADEGCPLVQSHFLSSSPAWKSMPQMHASPWSCWHLFLLGFCVAPGLVGPSM